MKKYIYGAIAITLIGLIVALNITRLNLREARMEADRQSINNRVLQTGMETYIAKNGDLVARTETLTQTANELKRYNTDLVKKVDNLKIRIKDLQSATTINTSTDLTITTPLRDTIIKLQPVAKTFTYNDKWNKVTGIVSTDSVKIDIQSTDSLFVFHNIEKYKFLFIRWGVKNEWYTITNSNPSTKIEGFKVIEIKH